MSAASDYPKVARRAELERQVNLGRKYSDYTNAITELDTLRFELAALKARRCDGCVRWGAVYVSGPYAGMASCDGQPVDDCGCGAAPMTTPDHACNAWTPKPEQLKGTQP